MTVTLDRPAAATGTPAATGPAGARGQRSARAHFRPDIGGLRAVAVLLVVLYHARVPGVTGGYVGVDVFFVISGFLITGQIVREIELRGRLDLVGFYARRMRRLLPAALIVIVATVVVARLSGPLLEVGPTATDGLYAALYAINFHLAAQGIDYQQSTGPVSPLQHFWSLAVEEQFYLVWPALVIVVAIAVARRRPSLVRPLIGVTAALGVAASLYWSVVVTQRSAPQAYFSVQTRAWEFGVGALVAVFAARLAQLPRRATAPLSWLGLGVVVATAFVFDDNTPFPGAAALWPVLGTGVLIAAGCRGQGADRAGAARALSVRPAQWVGRVSYGWYLWHWPMLVLAPSVLGYDLSWIRGLEISFLALWLAALTHIVVELPTQRPALRRYRWVTIGLALSAATAGAAVLTSANAPAIAGSGRYAAPVDLAGSAVTQLRATLDQSSRSTDVPNNLTPAVGRAAADVPVTESGGCHAGFLQITQGPCEFGDLTGAHTVVLFGDSKAQQWDGAFIAAADRLHWRVVSWTKSACPVADMQIVNETLKREYSECDTWRARTVRRIIALHPDLVVASESDRTPGTRVSDAQWAFATARTLVKFTSAGIRTLYFADTPYPTSDAPSCVAAHQSDTAPCSSARGQAHDSGGGGVNYEYRHRTVNETVGSAGVPVFDPITWFCGPQVCPVIVGDVFVYRDTGHVTNTYSRTLGPLVEPLLTRTTR